MAMRKPSSTSPSTAEAGTWQSSKNIWQVLEARMPSFFSFAPARRPGVSAGIRKAVMPRAFGTSGLVTAYTRYRPASPPLVIQLLVPFSTQLPSGWRRALACMFEASEPEVASLKQ